MKEVSAHVYRNIITHHRNQIKLLCHWVRGGQLRKELGIKLAKSHADEIRQTLRDWKLSYPVKRN